MVQVNEIIHNRWLNKNMEVMCDLKRQPLEQTNNCACPLQLSVSHCLGFPYERATHLESGSIP